MQSNSTMQLRASCDIITSQLEERTITHKWTEVYSQTNSPTNAVLAFNKKRNRYVSMTRLLPHIAKVNIGNYVFFMAKKDCPDDEDCLQDFNGMANLLNENRIKLKDEIHINVKCTEYFVEGMSPRIRYFVQFPSENITSSLPGFQKFREYKKCHR